MIFEGILSEISSGIISGFFITLRIMEIYIPFNNLLRFLFPFLFFFITKSYFPFHIEYKIVETILEILFHSLQ